MSEHILFDQQIVECTALNDIGDYFFQYSTSQVPSHVPLYVNALKWMKQWFYTMFTSLILLIIHSHFPADYVVFLVHITQCGCCEPNMTNSNCLFFIAIELVPIHHYVGLYIFSRQQGNNSTGPLIIWHLGFIEGLVELLPGTPMYQEKPLTVQKF